MSQTLSLKNKIGFVHIIDAHFAILNMILLVGASEVISSYLAIAVCVRQEAGRYWRLLNHVCYSSS